MMTKVWQRQYYVILSGMFGLLLTGVAAFQSAIWRNSGTLAWLKGDLSTARSALEMAVKDQPADSILHWHLYGIYEREGLTSMAISQLRLSGYDWQTLSHMGDTFLWSAQDWANALLWYARARNVHENSTILFKLGRVYELSGVPLSAVDFYTQALQLNTFETNEVDASNVLVRLATIYRVEFSDHDKALALATQALALDQFGTRAEDRAQAYYLQGEIGSQQGRDPAFCIERFQQALKAFPDHYWANLLLGREYYRAGLPLEVAANQMRYAISLLPQNKWGYLMVAALYAEAGNIAEATRYYKQVLTLAPDDLTATQFLQNNP